MTFSPTFGRTFSPLFKPNSLAISGGVWLTGGIPAANCVAAWQAKGAASYDSSLIDLTGNGHVLSPSDYAPPWDAVNGWCTGRWRAGYTYYGLITDIVPQVGYSIAIRAVRVFDTGTKVFNSEYFALTLDFSIDGNLWARTNSGYGGTATEGVFVLSGGKGYIDGTLVKTLTDTNNSTNPLSIGRGDNPGSKIYIKEVFIYSSTIDAQVAALSAAMAAL